MDLKMPNHPTKTQPLNLRGKRILVVDDFANFRITMKNMLSSLGADRIDEAMDGKEAVDKMSWKKYDLVMCDYNLGPGKDGQQVLEEARHRKFISAAEIFIMVTAENTMDMFMGAVEYKPDDYLIKPFTRENLEKKIKNLLEKKALLHGVEKAVEDSEYERALTMCEREIQNKPRNLVDFYRLKGEILLKMGNYGETELYYKSIMTMGKLPWAMIGAAQVQLATERYAEARDTLEQLIAMNDKVMAAYDLLAVALKRLGESEAAQQVLMNAVAISPKEVKRQRELGQIAYDNKDLAVAEKSLKTAIKQGKHSCFKSPENYTILAKVMTDNDKGDEGIAVLQEATREFEHDREGLVKIAVAESIVFTKLKQPDKAKKATERAMSMVDGHREKMSADVDLELAKVMIMQGNMEDGRKLMKHLIQSNHEDTTVLNQVQQAFRDLQMEDEGQRIIDTAVDEVITLNNEGVRLVKDGELQKAISYFQQAAESLPDNKVINANAAYAHILYMQKNKPDPEYLLKVRVYLDRVKRLDAVYKDLEKLRSMYKLLMLE